MAGVRRTATALALAVLMALSACTGDPGDADATPSAPQASPTGSPPEATPLPTPTDDAGPDVAPTEEPEETGGPADPVPEGFAEPEALIGQELSSEQAADGSLYTVVGGVPLEPPYLFGACFDGGTDDVCAYAIEAAGPRGADGDPAASDAALLLLLRSTGSGERPTWVVLDAIITRPPAPPALLQVCEGEPGVAFYAAAGGEPTAGTVPAAAAWGPDAALTELVELDPAGVTCQFVGD